MAQLGPKHVAEWILHKGYRCVTRKMIVLCSLPISLLWQSSNCSFPIKLPVLPPSYCSFTMLTMEAEISSETSVTSYTLNQCHIPEHCSFNNSVKISTHMMWQTVWMDNILPYWFFYSLWLSGCMTTGCQLLVQSHQTQRGHLRPLSLHVLQSFCLNTVHTSVRELSLGSTHHAQMKLPTHTLNI